MWSQSIETFNPYEALKGEKKEKSQTNADRIRAMSDEELADWLARTQIDNVASALKIAGFPFEEHPDLKDEVKKDALEWLKQPAEVGNDTLPVIMPYPL